MSERPKNTSHETGLQAANTLRLIDQVCDAFETALRDGSETALEEFLDRLPQEVRGRAIVELLALEVDYRSGTGVTSLGAEYERRFPLYVDAVREAFRRCESNTVGDRTVLHEPVESTPESTKQIGDYRLLSEISRGGMGVVYRARQISLNRDVALKRILSGARASEEEIARFRREAEAAAQLDHPHIVPIYEVGEHDETPFFSMKLIEGTSLTAEVVRLADDPKSAASTLAKVARAVHHAHQRGILHRDLKPGNVLIDLQGEPHVTDFGLSRRVEGDSELTLSGVIVGTPSYMAPEQAAGLRSLTTAADVFSLGAVFYQLLTGRRPFSADSVLGVLKLVVETDPPAPRSLKPSLDRDLETICLRCLEKDPARRYDSAAALADDLERWLRGEAIAARPMGRGERLWRSIRRNPGIASLSAAVLLLLVTTAVGATIGYFREAELKRTALKDRDTAQDMRRKEAEARRDADDQRQAAVVARSEETALRQSTQRTLVETHFERGRTLCQKGDIAQGLLWMARALVALPPHATDLEPAIRRNIAAWEPFLFEHRLVGSHGTTVWCGAFHPDGTLIATGSEDGTARLWNAESGEPVGETMPHAKKVRRAIFNSSGSLLLTCSEDGTARFWDGRTGAPMGEPLQHTSQVGGVAFSPDEKLIATGTWDGNVHLWDATTRQRIGAPLLQGGAVSSVDFSPNGELLVAGSTDSTVDVWNVANRTRLRESIQHPDWVVDVAFRPDGRAIVTACKDGRARLWSTENGQQLASPLDQAGFWMRRAEFNPAGTLIATASEGAGVWLWDSSTGRKVGPELRHSLAAKFVTFSRDGQRLLMGAADGTFRIYRVGMLAPEARVIPHPNKVYYALYHPDGETVVTTCEDGGVRFWKTGTGELIGSPLMHAAPAFYAAFSRDGTQLATTGSLDKTARIWDVTTRTSKRAPLLHPAKVMGVGFSTDGKTVMTACYDGLVRFWDVASGELIEPSLKHDGPAHSVVASPNGRHVLTASMRGVIQKWGALTHERVGRSMQLPAEIFSARYNPDGSLIVAGGGGKTARLWTSEGEPFGKPLPHLSNIIGTTFDPSGQIILTASQFGAAQLWDVATQDPIGPPLPHDLQVNGVDFSPDGTVMVTGSDDRNLRFWNVPQPISGDPRQIARNLEVMASMEILSDGTVVELGLGDWKQRHRQLEDRPEPRSDYLGPASPPAR